MTSELVKAWIKQGGSLQLADVPKPSPASDEAIVRVEAISLNRGEIRTVARAAEGTIPGWDIAGTIVEEAANGKGPKRGTRVAALLDRGGWAEFVTVPASRAAVVPDGVELDVAATLPIAGLTVVRALAVAGSLLGRRVLVTGGSGGVGQLATQLAAVAGASDVAAVRAVTADVPGQFDFILESAGGSSLALAIDRVARGGMVVTIGNSSEEETTFNARTLYAKGGASVYGLLVFEEVESGRVGARDLERLLALVRDGKLRAPIEVRRSFAELPAVLEELERRAFSGKAVLVLD
jgi:NADPH:quinone reductase